jgi:hypothetical protein
MKKYYFSKFNYLTLDCTCGHQVPKHESIIWAAMFSVSQANLLEAWKSANKTSLTDDHVKLNSQG